MQAINVVWLKRDLRLEDHQPLAAACETELPTLIAYCFEPSLLQDPHWQDSHQAFIVESLADLAQQLQTHGLQLHVFWCDAVTLLEHLHQDFRLVSLRSHQEVGLAKSFDRDRQVRQWCKQRGVEWIESQQVAVQRGQDGRKNWKAFADDFLQQPLSQPRLKQLKGLTIQPDQAAFQLKCRQLPRAWLTAPANYQRGGESQANARLSAFLEQPPEEYRRHISRPATSRTFSSRLSAYLAYGNLSIRQVVQSLQAKSHSGQTRAFYSRLRWHCHFIQKFESDCRMEFEPLNPAYQKLLSQEQAQLDPVRQQERFQAWAEGQTGYPLVDAAMRALLTCGFVNFRMRALLVSVAVHHLQLDWKAVAIHLAQQFLDLDPGIHYPQIQMQAGLTGFNTLRIYNPVQQSLDKDAEALFISEYLPELAALPTPLKHQPWLMTPLEAQMYPTLAEGYCQPLFDAQQTGREARERLWRWQKSPEVQAWVPRLLANQVVQRPAVNA